MKKLSTIFPMWENSLGIKNYNHPSKIRKIFIAFVFVFLTGFAFGQNETQYVEQSTIKVEQALLQPIQESNIESSKVEKKSDKGEPANSKRAVIEKTTGQDNFLIPNQENIEMIRTAKQVNAKKVSKSVPVDSDSKNEKANPNENSSLTESDKLNY
ncbi:MAG: hypothetical protein WCY16_05320 [Weeksellaceae bacterium]